MAERGLLRGNLTRPGVSRHAPICWLWTVEPPRPCVLVVCRRRCRLRWWRQTRRPRCCAEGRARSRRVWGRQRHLSAYRANHRTAARPCRPARREPRRVDLAVRPEHTGVQRAAFRRYRARKGAAGTESVGGETRWGVDGRVDV